MCEVSKALAVLMPATHDPAHCGVHKISQPDASTRINSSFCTNHIPNVLIRGFGFGWFWYFGWWRNYVDSVQMCGVIFGPHANQSCSSVPIFYICGSFGHNVCRLFVSATILDVHLVTCAEYVAKPSEIYSVRSRDMAQCWVFARLENLHGCLIIP